MKRFLIAAAILASTTAFAKDMPKVYGNEALAPHTSAEKEIAGLFDRWNAALATGNPAEVAKLYAPKGVLLPTVSNQVRATPAAITDYFVHFLELKPKGTINYREIRVLDKNTAIDNGVYTFAIVKDGQPGTVQARYTYVYEKIGGTWKIMAHHSSAMPEKADAS